MEPTQWLNRAVTSSSTFAERTIFTWYILLNWNCNSCIWLQFVCWRYVSGLTTSVGNSTYSSTATKVTYTQYCAAIKASSDEGATFSRPYLVVLVSIRLLAHHTSVIRSTKYASELYRKFFLSSLVEEKSSSVHSSDWSRIPILWHLYHDLRILRRFGWGQVPPKGSSLCIQLLHLDQACVKDLIGNPADYNVCMVGDEKKG